MCSQIFDAEALKPKIGILHYSSPPDMGGVERILLKQAEEFAKHGYEVTIICGRGSITDPELKFELIPELDPQNKQTLDVNRKMFDAPENTKEARNFSRQIKNKLEKVVKQLDILFLHNVMVRDLNFPLVQAITELSQKYTEKRFVSFAHDPALSESRNSNLLTVPFEFPWTMLSNVVATVETVAVSEGCRDFMASLYKVSPESIPVIPNGVDIEAFLGLKGPVLELWRKYQLTQAEMIIFCPSRIASGKNIERAISITDEICKTGINVKLILSGEVDYGKCRNGSNAYYAFLKTEVRRMQLEENVVFFNDFAGDKNSIELELDNIRSLYALSDLLLITSSDEGFALAMLEGALSRMVIACSDIKAFREIEDPSIVYLGLTEPLCQVAEKIIEAVDRDPKRKLFRKVIHDYDWGFVFSEFLRPLVSPGQEQDN